MGVVSEWSYVEEEEEEGRKEKAKAGEAFFFVADIEKSGRPRKPSYQGNSPVMVVANDDGVFLFFPTAGQLAGLLFFYALPTIGAAHPHTDDTK